MTAVDAQVLDGILVIVSITGIFLHALGCYVLLSLSRNGQQSLHQTFQNLYLIQFAFCECLTNVLQLLRCVSHLISPSSTIKEFHTYLDIINLAGTGTVYYLSISFVTVDRFLDIQLNIRYAVYWSEKQAKSMVISSWLIGFFVSVILTLVQKLHHTNFYQFLFTYYFLPLNLAYLFIAIISYSFIFHKYKKTRSKPRQEGVRRRRCGVTEAEKPTMSNAFEAYRNSRFHVPVLIIVSFVTLKFIPDVIAQIMFWRTPNTCKVVLRVCFISYAILGIFSSYVYILIQTPVRTLLDKKAKKARRRWSMKRHGGRQKCRRNGIVSMNTEQLPGLLLLWQREVTARQMSSECPSLMPSWQREARGEHPSLCEDDSVDNSVASVPDDDVSDNVSQSDERDVRPAWQRGLAASDSVSDNGSGSISNDEHDLSEKSSNSISDHDDNDSDVSDNLQDKLFDDISDISDRSRDSGVPSGPSSKYSSRRSSCIKSLTVSCERTGEEMEDEEWDEYGALVLDTCL